MSDMYLLMLKRNNKVPTVNCQKAHESLSAIQLSADVIPKQFQPPSPTSAPLYIHSLQQSTKYTQPPPCPSHFRLHIPIPPNPKSIPRVRIFQTMSARTDTEATNTQLTSGVTPDTLKSTIQTKLEASHVEIVDLSGIHAPSPPLPSPFPHPHLALSKNHTATKKIKIAETK